MKANYVVCALSALIILLCGSVIVFEAHRDSPRLWLVFANCGLIAANIVLIAMNVLMIRKPH